MRDTTWKPVSAERCWLMLNAAPPALETRLGFLVGEAVEHRTCSVTGRPDQPSFAAFAVTEALGVAYEASAALTYAMMGDLGVTAEQVRAAGNPIIGDNSAINAAA